MAVKPFNKEELNFFKFSSIVLNEFPNMLRQTFVTMWDNNISSLPGYQVWDDSLAVRNQLLNREGGKTDIPTLKSIDEWDCTALFKATIFSKTFGLTTLKSTKSTTLTLSQQYVKGKKHGSFHSSVISPTGNQDETLTLAIDQLRLLRNTLCHISKPVISKGDFDQYVQLAKDAFTAAGVAIVRIDGIGCLKEEDFPTEKVSEINERIKAEYKFLQEEVVRNISDVQDGQKSVLQSIHEMKHDVRDLSQEVVRKTSDFQDGQKSVLQSIHEIKADVRDRSQEVVQKISDVQDDIHEIKADVRDLSKGKATLHSLPDSCVPPLVPHFVGRNEECGKAVNSMMSPSTRIFSIWGSPGFGKTSTAIAIANRLQRQKECVYYFTYRGVTNIEGFFSKLRSCFISPMSNTVLTPADELISFFRSATARCFVILDNLDDLLSQTFGEESGLPVSQKVLNFMLEVLQQCENIVFLTTTRSSLEFLSLEIRGAEHFRIQPLEQTFSESLVVQYLPTATTFIKCQITKICGNIPLAIRMLCVLMSGCDENTINNFLEELRKGSASLLDAIDESRNLFPDTSLKQLFEKAFEKLSEEEKRNLIILTIYDGADFNINAVTAVFKKSYLETTKILKDLERKSLIEFNNESKQYTFHPLIQSFVMTKIRSDPNYSNHVNEAKMRRLSVIANFLRQMGDSMY